MPTLLKKFLRWLGVSDYRAQDYDEFSHLIEQLACTAVRVSMDPISGTGLYRVTFSATSRHRHALWVFTQAVPNARRFEAVRKMQSATFLRLQRDHPDEQRGITWENDLHLARPPA